MPKEKLSDAQHEFIRFMEFVKSRPEEYPEHVERALQGIRQLKELAADSDVPSKLEREIDEVRREVDAGSGSADELAVARKLLAVIELRIATAKGYFRKLNVARAD